MKRWLRTWMIQVVSSAGHLQENSINIAPVLRKTGQKHLTTRQGYGGGKNRLRIKALSWFVLKRLTFVTHPVRVNSDKGQTLQVCNPAATGNFIPFRPVALRPRLAVEFALLINYDE